MLYACDCSCGIVSYVHTAILIIIQGTGLPERSDVSLPSEFHYTDLHVYMNVKQHVYTLRLQLFTGIYIFAGFLIVFILLVLNFAWASHLILYKRN